MAGVEAGAEVLEEAGVEVSEEAGVEASEGVGDEEIPILSAVSIPGCREGGGPTGAAFIHSQPPIVMYPMRLIDNYYNRTVYLD